MVIGQEHTMTMSIILGLDPKEVTVICLLSEVVITLGGTSGGD